MNTWTANGEGFWSFSAGADPTRATLSVDVTRKWPHKVNPRLYGKFCEHLGNNIYGGMEAQILENPTFGRWQFDVGADPRYGGWQPEHHTENIRSRVKGWAQRKRLPEAERYVESHEDGGAMGWFRIGAKEQVTLSPDVGPHGGRAQRVEINADDQPLGIGQWTYLPLHRTRKFEYRIVARSVEPTPVSLTMSSQAGVVLAQMPLTFTTNWQTFEGALALPDGTEELGVYRVAITTLSRANIVFGRVLLYPSDHLDHADPEAIAMLRESRLPLLRWPGGNFVSGWDWHDSIGPVDARPTRANPAWGGLEYNLFGTDEFIAYCRAVGCEPMICINAGSDTPESAGEWVEYCNGPATSPMGALRAANGHPEPYAIKYWEVGNELWGRFQVGWTTPEGNADRYLRYAIAMLKADTTITLAGCGCTWWKENAWNIASFEKTGGLLRMTTDHLLCGGEMTKDDSQADVYHYYTALARPTMAEYARIRKTMESAGIREPRMAITEMQIFPSYIGEEPAAGAAGLRRDDLPRPNTISEAIYATTLIHESIRLGDFVEMITHSATVNHGGGLAKARQRTYANPVHFAHTLGSSLINATPVAIEIQCCTFGTKRRYGSTPPLESVPALDVMAGISADGSQLVLILVHRSAESGPITLQLAIEGLLPECPVQIATVAGDSPSDKNTMDEPTRIAIRGSTATYGDALVLPPFSLTRVILPLR